MLDNPPPYTPEPSLWDRTINWVKPLRVAVEELRPDVPYVELVLAAIHDIRLCEEIFDGWMTRSIHVTSSSKMPDEQEPLLNFYLGLLREDVGRCSREANAILQLHARFADLMAQWIDDASKSWFKRLNCDESETIRLAGDISQFSRSLSLHVTNMMKHLSLLVPILEKIGVKERTLAERILGWLKSLFKTLARIFVAPFLRSVAPGVCGNTPASSTLEKRAASFCGAGSELHEEKESENTKSVVLFLKEVVPRETQAAQKRLERFDEGMFVMKLIARMKTGRWVALRGLDLAAVAKEWRVVAEKYRSHWYFVLPVGTCASTSKREQAETVKEQKGHITSL